MVHGENLHEELQTIYPKCQGSLRELFTKLPDIFFSNHVKEFYLNLSSVETLLRSSIKGVKIDIHKDQFSRMFELPF